MNIRLLLSIIIFLFYSTLSSTFCFADYIDDAMCAADKKNWNKALAAAKSPHDPVLRKIILSRQYLDPNDRSATFEEIISFATMNPNWPRISQIRENAELHLNESTPKNVIVKWFLNNKPQTPNGYKFFALSAKSIIKNQAQLAEIIRNGWIYGNFTPEEARRFRLQNKAILTAEDDLLKIDSLMWNNQRSLAKQVASNFGGTHAKIYLNAFIALIDGKPNANHLFASLPKSQQHNSGILYRYLSQFKKDDRIMEHVAKMILKVNHDPIHATEWCKMRSLFAKNMMQQKKYNLAYQISSTHNGDSAKDISESEWLAGWIALKYLHNPSEAFRHFANMNKVVKMSISRAKSSYGMGLAAKAMGNKDLEHKWFTAAASYNFTFPGQLAMLELKKHSITLPSHPPKIMAFDKKLYKNNDLARAANMMIKHGRNDLALRYAQAAIASAQNSGEAALIVDSIKNCRNLHYTTEIAKSAAHQGYVMMQANYPTPYKFDKIIDPALTYSIILRESVFDQHAISNANAHGLMQILPSTACKTAQKLHKKAHCSTRKLTHDTSYNINIGNRYLKQLIDRYNGSYLLAIAAYNAGPEPVDRWIQSNGDPRKMKNIDQVVHWIESIPYWETREYVQRVLENVQIYRKILGSSSNIQLHRDLLRGK